MPETDPEGFYIINPNLWAVFVHNAKLMTCQWNLPCATYTHMIVPYLVSLYIYYAVWFNYYGHMYLNDQGKTCGSHCSKWRHCKINTLEHGFLRRIFINCKEV